MNKRKISNPSPPHPHLRDDVKNAISPFIIFSLIFIRIIKTPRLIQYKDTISPICYDDSAAMVLNMYTEHALVLHEPGGGASKWDHGAYLLTLKEGVPPPPPPPPRVHEAEFQLSSLSQFR